MTVDVREYEVRLFNQVSLEISAMCNRACVFCPNHTTARPDELMPWDVVLKVLNELHDLRYDGFIAPYLYNEPMRDPRIYDFIRETRQRVPRALIRLNTNGDYLRDAEDILKLREAGLHRLIINIYSERDGDADPERREAGARVAERRYQQVLAWLMNIGLANSDGVYQRNGKREFRVQLLRKFGGRFEGGFELQNRSGNITWNTPALTEPLEKMCVRPWRMLNINWQGDVVLCCNDYHGAMTFGNVRDRTLLDMWNDDRMNHVRLLLQNRKRDFTLCDACDYKGGAYQHVIDNVTFGPENDARLLAQRPAPHPPAGGG